MKIVVDILNAKGHSVWSIHPDSTVFEALQRMAEKDVGALLVIKDDHLVGVFSEQDYARKVILQGKSSLNTAVHEIMTDKVLFVRPEQTVEECMALMTQNRVRHLPVLDGSKLTGVISIGDVVKEMLADRDMELEALENYISGRDYVADALKH